MKENASTFIPEMGVDMDVFPNEIHLSSWPGMSLDNNESAGKKKSGSTTYGNKFLKTMLTEFGLGCLQDRARVSKFKIQKCVDLNW